LWKVNYRLTNSKPENVFERLEIASLLEGILHNTGNYRGFCFNQVKVVDGVADCGDESRRFYFISPALVDCYIVGVCW
jgi:hypothetical protein